MDAENTLCPGCCLAFRLRMNGPILKVYFMEVRTVFYRIIPKEDRTNSEKTPNKDKAAEKRVQASLLES
jgi:hypothetical protein